MTCKNCGGEFLGDGYTSVVACENIDTTGKGFEPDAGPIHCRKIIFLDMDGVMNNGKVFEELEGMTRRVEDMVDPDCVARLNQIIERTGAKVVISSTWRKLFDVETMQKILDRHGFKGEVVGATPTLWFDDKGNRLHRGHEIQEWLDTRGLDVTSFVILDDDSDMVHLLPRLVHTNTWLGLVDEQIEHAVKMLETPC